MRPRAPVSALPVCHSPCRCIGWHSTLMRRGGVRARPAAGPRGEGRTGLDPNVSRSPARPRRLAHPFRLPIAYPRPPNKPGSGRVDRARAVSTGLVPCQPAHVPCQPAVRCRFAQACRGLSGRRRDEGPAGGGAGPSQGSRGGGGIAPSYLSHYGKVFTIRSRDIRHSPGRRCESLPARDRIAACPSRNRSGSLRRKDEGRPGCGLT